MSIISYAQNGEDIVLSRALADVSKGFYIDVGAQDPTVDSVTRLFYEREWSGVNVEPVLHWHTRLEEQRPRDINLCVAAGDHHGEISLFEVIGTGLSTTLGDVADRHVAAGRQVVERDVALTTLDDICATHGIERVHFLKVDVEGAETSVLRGISLDRIRPWIILVEATQPNTQVPSHEDWELLLTDRGYQFVYADGLNRFYLADEQQRLRSSFAVPPNYFDDFITYREHVGREYATELESKLESLYAQATGLREQLGDTQAQNERVQAALDRVMVERSDLIAQMDAVHAAAENRQKRIEQLSDVVESRQMRVVQLVEELNGSLAESARLSGDLQVLLKTAQNRQNRIIELQRQHTGMASELEIMRLGIAERDAILAMMFSSHSWRLTKPLRVSRRIVAGLLRRGLARPVRALGRNLLKASWVHRSTHRMLESHPALRTRLSIFLFGPAPTELAAKIAAADAASRTLDISLSAREREVLSIFEQADRSKDSVPETN